MATNNEKRVPQVGFSETFFDDSGRELKTLRDEIAIAAMVELLKDRLSARIGPVSGTWLAAECYDIADAFMKRRRQEPPT